MNARNTWIREVISGLTDRPGTPESRYDKISWLGALRVRDIMSSPAICTDPRSSVTSAHLLMREHGIRRLPVVEDRRLVGIITLGDVRGALPSEVSSLNHSELRYLAEQLKVGTAMTRKVATVAADASLKEAARMLGRGKIGGLPVLSAAGSVVGVVTESDIFKALVELLEIDEHGLLPHPA